MITLNNAACYEWELIPIEKVLLLTYNWLLKRIENSHHWSAQMQDSEAAIFLRNK